MRRDTPSVDQLDSHGHVPGNVEDLDTGIHLSEGDNTGGRNRKTVMQVKDHEVAPGRQ
jgi:hypothetical protein